MPAFGGFIQAIREDRFPSLSVEAITRQLSAQEKIKVDDSTLRMYEYGYVDKPDPVVLLGLARLYRADIHILIAVLRANRENKHLSKFELEHTVREAIERNHVETAAAARLAEVQQRLRKIGLELLELGAETTDLGRPNSLPRDGTSAGDTDS